MSRSSPRPCPLASDRQGRKPSPRLRARRAACVLVLSLLPVTAGAARSLQGELDAVDEALLSGRTPGMELRGARTKVVPARDADTGELVGAYQVAGPRGRVDEVVAVLEWRGLVDAFRRARGTLLVPSSKAESAEEVEGVRVVAAVELPERTERRTFVTDEMSGGPSSETRRLSAVTPAELDEAGRELGRLPPSVPPSRTEVVPVRLHPGGAGLGLAQVEGPAAARIREVRVVTRSMGRRGVARFLVPLDQPGVLDAAQDVGIRALVVLLPALDRGPGIGSPATPATASPGLRRRSGASRRSSSLRGSGPANLPP